MTNPISSERLMALVVELTRSLGLLMELTDDYDAWNIESLRLGAEVLTQAGQPVPEVVKLVLDEARVPVSTFASAADAPTISDPAALGMIFRAGAGMGKALFEYAPEEGVEDADIATLHMIKEVLRKAQWPQPREIFMALDHFNASNDNAGR